MKEYSSAEYFNAWKPQGGSYETLREQAPDLLYTVDMMMRSKALFGKRAFLREIEGELVLTPDIQFYINNDFKRGQE